MINMFNTICWLISRSPNSLLIEKKVSLGRGFVKTSTNWFFVSTNSNMQSPFWTWSRRKWCLISICFVLECKIGFLDRLIVLVLSQTWLCAGWVWRVFSHVRRIVYFMHLYYSVYITHFWYNCILSLSRCYSFYMFIYVSPFNNSNFYIVNGV